MFLFRGWRCNKKIWNALTADSWLFFWQPIALPTYLGLYFYKCMGWLGILLFLSSLARITYPLSIAQFLSMSAFWDIGQRPWAMDELELAYLRSSFLEPKDGEIQMLQHLSCFILLHPASRNGALVSLPTWWLGNLPDTWSACRFVSQSKSESILYREDSLKSDWDSFHPILPYPLTKTGFFFGESDVSEKSKHLRPLQEPSDRRCEDADDI